jgi:pimeloyl-ACP methyl ester carboxylesterase
VELHTDELILRYDDTGPPDAPPVLVLHGITQSTTTWEWLVPHLAGRHRVVRLDFRGHGRSGRTPGAYNYRGYVADATAICEQVLGRPAFVIGHSLGGGTAAGLAQTRPDLVRGVVLEDPAIMVSLSAAPSRTEPVSLEGNPLLDGFRLMRESVPQLQAAGMSIGDLVSILRAAPASSGNGTFGDVAHEDALIAMADGMLHLDASVLDVVLDDSIDPVFDPHRPLGVPGIVVAGDQAMPDTIVREPEIALLAAHSPDVDVRVAQGVGHMIHDSKAQRDMLLEAIEDLLTVA